MFATLRLACSALIAWSCACGAVSATEPDPAQTVLHMLDYVAVDYAGAVADGKVIDEAEYAEMREFTASAIGRIEALPAHARRDALVAQVAPHAGGALIGGLIVAAAALAGIAWLVFRYSVRLPIGPFFAVTSILIAALAVVFAGQGVAALQEAGAMPVTPVAFVALPAIGVFPTAQTLAALAVLASFYLTRRRRIAAMQGAT